MHFVLHMHFFNPWPPTGDSLDAISLRPKVISGISPSNAVPDSSNAFLGSQLAMMPAVVPTWYKSLAIANTLPSTFFRSKGDLSNLGTLTKTELPTKTDLNFLLDLLTMYSAFLFNPLFAPSLLCSIDDRLEQKSQNIRSSFTLNVSASRLQSHTEHTFRAVEGLVLVPATKMSLSESSFKKAARKS